MNKRVVFCLSVIFLLVACLLSIHTFVSVRSLEEAKVSGERKKEDVTVYEAVPDSVLESIVGIDIYDEDGELAANASGFIAFEPKRLVTCLHVLKGMAYAICTTERGETFRIEDICAKDEEADLALCTIPKDCDIRPLKTARMSLKRGEGVVAVGNQFGLLNVVTRGNASLVKDSFILFTAPVSAGSSGGALLNASCEVCGVVRGTYSDGQNINTAVPIDTVVRLVASCMENETEKRQQDVQMTEEEE